MTDSYHFESVPKFRVGGVYRDGTGEAIRLLRPWSDDKEFAIGEYLTGHEAFSGAGALSLVNGRYLYGEEGDILALIPGELVERDGQWVAADAPIVFQSGAAVLTSGGKIVGRVEAEALADGLSPIAAEAAASLGTVAIDEDDIAWAAASAKPEPIRAPLPHFNQRTEFDPFPDYVVFHEFEPVAPLHTSPTTDSAYPAIAGLLRG